MNIIPRRMSPRSSSFAFMFLSLNMMTPQMKDMMTELRRTSETTEIMDEGSLSEVKYAKSPMHMNMDINGMAQRHYDHLVEIEPALDEHRVEGLHQELVVQSAYSSRQGGYGHAPYPSVFPEIDILLFSCTAHHEDGSQGKQHTDPLIQIQPFSEEYQGTDKNKHRSGRIDRADNGKRQVLQTEITADPRSQDDACLQNHQKMCP